MPERIFTGWRQFAVMLLPDLKFGVVATEPVIQLLGYMTHREGNDFEERKICLS